MITAYVVPLVALAALLVSVAICLPTGQKFKLRRAAACRAPCWKRVFGWLKHVRPYLTTEVKILIGFWQIVSKIGRVYGVVLPHDVSRVLRFLETLVSFGLDSASVFSFHCVGIHRFESRLLFWLLAPIGVIIAIVLFHALRRCFMFGHRKPAGRALDTCFRCTDTNRTSAREMKRRRPCVAILQASLPQALFLFFLAAPIVTTTAFDAFLCYDFSEGSVLKADVAVACSGGPSITRIRAIAYVAIAMYPIGGWIATLAALLVTKKHILSGKWTRLTRATMFLHGDYQPIQSAYAWELVEVPALCPRPTSIP